MHTTFPHNPVLVKLQTTYLLREKVWLENEWEPSLFFHHWIKISCLLSELFGYWWMVLRGERISRKNWAVVVHGCNPSYSGGRDQEDHSSKPAQIVQESLSWKYPTQKRVGRVTQMIELLPNKCEALSSRVKMPVPKKRISRRRTCKFVNRITIWFSHS
jgi:hypothetical protein